MRRCFFAMGLLFTGYVSAVPIMISEDFTTIGPEWSVIGGFDNGDAGILGQLHNSVVTLSFDGMAGGSAAMEFDLIGFRTVDGVNCCTDTFSLLINGIEVFNANFPLGGGGSESINVNMLGAVVTGAGLMRNIAIPAFSIIAGTNEVTFDYGLMQGFNDEAWGLDNFLLEGDVRERQQNPNPMPEPGVLGMLLVGAGLLMRRKR